jgi:hypothetical protein
MVCPPATSEAEARWPRFGLVVVVTTSRRDNKDQMIRPLVYLRIKLSKSTGTRRSGNYQSSYVYIYNPAAYTTKQFRIYCVTVSIGSIMEKIS